MGKVLSDLCIPKENFNSELLVPSKVQLQKSGTVFQSRMFSYATPRRLLRIGKQYANMLEENVAWSQVLDQTFEVLLTAVRLSESPTSWSNSCQGKKGQVSRDYKTAVEF